MCYTNPRFTYLLTCLLISPARIDPNVDYLVQREHGHSKNRVSFWARACNIKDQVYYVCARRGANAKWMNSTRSILLSNFCTSLILWRSRLKSFHSLLVASVSQYIFPYVLIYCYWSSLFWCFFAPSYFLITSMHDATEDFFCYVGRHI